MKHFFTLIAFTISYILFAQTQVVVVSTLHKNHLQNPNYTYEDVSKTIEKFNPDILAVEIRAEDLYLPKDTLVKRYPVEMHSNLFTNSKIQYFGIDWYGDDIVGKACPHDYFDHENSIKSIQIKMNQDEEFKQKLEVLKPLIQAKFDLVKNASMNEMMDGTYDLINEIYYKQIEILTQNTPYQKVAEFYTLRDLRIAQNTEKIILQNPNKKIMVLTGADHRVALVKYLNQNLNDKIKIINHL